MLKLQNNNERKVRWKNSKKSSDNKIKKEVSLQERLSMKNIRQIIIG